MPVLKEDGKTPISKKVFALEDFLRANDMSIDVQCGEILLTVGSYVFRSANALPRSTNEERLELIT